MPTGLLFEKTTRSDILDLQDRIRPLLRSATTLESAAQIFAESIYREFRDSVLSRVFLTIPMGCLPEESKAVAWRMAIARGVERSLHERSPVLSLLGTYGKEAPWRDRRQSIGHQNIPLCSQEFVDSIPMIARLLGEMGVDVNYDGTRGEDTIPKTLAASWAGLFHVADARTAVDGKGRHIIPARAFVEEHGVRTVFGLGKAYGNGWIATLIAFTRTSIPREKIEELAPVMTMFKAATMELMNLEKVFALLGPEEQSDA